MTVMTNRVRDMTFGCDVDGSRCRLAVICAQVGHIGIAKKLVSVDDNDTNIFSERQHGQVENIPQHGFSFGELASHTLQVVLNRAQHDKLAIKTLLAGFLH